MNAVGLRYLAYAMSVIAAFINGCLAYVGIMAILGSWHLSLGIVIPVVLLCCYLVIRARTVLLRHVPWHVFGALGIFSVKNGFIFGTFDTQAKI